MKKLVILVMILFPLSKGIGSAPIQVQFFNGSLDEAVQKASEEGKLYFIQFTADWCMPCQWMDQNTFQDAQLADYINTQIIAIKIDIDQKEGKRLQKKYDIKSLPSSLVFSAQGDLLVRKESSLAADRFLHLLRHHNKPENRQASQPPAYQVAILDSPKARINLSRPALIPDQPAQQTVQLAAVTSTPTTPPPAPPSNLETFGIQIGVYNDYYNAVQEVVRLEKRINLPVHLFTSRGARVYKVIIGPFPNHDGAQYYLQLLKQKSIKGLIKRMVDI